VLYDFPQGDSGALFEGALRLGVVDATSSRPLAEARPLNREVDFVTSHARGLPIGSEDELVRAFDELADSGVLAIVGPSISDNCLIAAPRADAHRVPSINYSGGERTRSEWMFHYQLGSLEEEPVILAERLHQRGLRRAAVIYDQSPVGRRYFDRFDAARTRCGIELAASIAIPTIADDLQAIVAQLQPSAPDALVYFGLGMASHAVAVALDALEWRLPVVANSALMFGYIRPAWRDAWAGWEYIDQIADDNPQRLRLAEIDPAAAAGPIGCTAFDIGRLLGTALAHCEHLTRSGVADALRNVKRLPSTTGHPGTRMGFGHYDHAALKGDYLVLREWKDGWTTQVTV
jgi:ABC-type branched-subunit amino acid transport system substrate-binding protein